MKKTFLFTVTAVMAFNLTACALEHKASMKSSLITEEPLAHGGVTRVGYQAPEASWKCRQLDRKSGSWAGDKFKSMIQFKLSPYQLLQEEAIAYANQKNLKPNYIQLITPSETYVNNFNLNPLAEAEAVYYRCQNPPAVKTSIF